MLQLLRLNLIILEKRAEKGDLIVIYRASKSVEKVSRDYLFKCDTWNTRGHEKMLRKINHYWNGLNKEIFQAGIINEFKAELDKC